MAHTIKPPALFDTDTGMFSIFLGGTIDMGNSFDWQADIAEKLADFEDVVLLNPRRDNWNNSWKQTIDTPEFYEQVTWELIGLDHCNLAIINLLPDSKSPISLMELGLMRDQHKTIVCCPPGFYRKGNVDIVCRRYGITLVESYKELVKLVRFHLASYQEADAAARKKDFGCGYSFSPPHIGDSYLNSGIIDNNNEAEYAF